MNEDKVLEIIDYFKRSLYNIIKQINEVVNYETCN